MTSELVLADWPAVAFAGLVAGVLVSLLRATWDGVGGKLGLLAFGGVYLTTLVARAFGAMGTGAPVLELNYADRLALIAVAPIAATLFGVLQIGFQPTIAGFGGDFGASAAVAVLVLLGVIELARLTGRWRQEDGPPTVPEEPPG
jgi:hypothetical protein